MIYFIRVGRTWDKLLSSFVHIIDDDIVACDVDQLLLLVHEETIVDLAVDAEDKSWSDGYSLH